MAGPLSDGAGVSPIQTPISAVPYTPSPITPTGGRPRLHPRRQSRFTEEVMSARTPAASVSEASFDHWYGPSTENINATATHDDNNNSTTFNPVPTPRRITPPNPSGWDRRTWMRSVNAGVHALPCLVLLGIIGYALRVLREDMGGHMSIQAIILIFFLFLDVILDIIVLSQARTPWPTWGLVLRFGCGLTYITHFLLYVGLGGVFPAGYTYWGLSTSLAEPLVYILLCVAGIWNLLHVPVSRYHLGGGTLARTRTPHPAAKRRPSTAAAAAAAGTRASSFAQRVSVAGTERSSISLTWRRWVRTPSSVHRSRDDLEDLGRGGGMVRGPSADMTLREQPSEEEEEKEKEKGGSESDDEGLRGIEMS
ncbi:hypothetical protein BT67DRAFT_434205 [Trichocladium antarcticum]|uniref:Uncharacterized protein n=1 Tax=Trichocladium antarcticum TaxID=1450529 RepID=A0AAN6UJJ8_9PEZI|nr:hypothetical protein BT67DRAFT_434205 [Trichocladium antarcticum]